MKTLELMTGLWCAKFAQGESGSEHFVFPAGTLKSIADYFETKKHEIEVFAGGVFNDESDEKKSIHATEFKYIRFPDFKLTNSEEVWNKYFDEEKILSNYESIENFKRLFGLIDVVRIDINPCIQDGEGSIVSHMTKVYVIPWRLGDIETGDIVSFLSICDSVSGMISAEIYRLYKNFICSSFGGYREKLCDSTFLTAVYCNKETRKTYDKILSRLESDETISIVDAQEIWEPLINFGGKILSKPITTKNFKPFVQTTVIGDESLQKGIFGITVGKDKKTDSELTYLIGTAPFSRDVALGVHLPIIKKN